MKYFAGAREAVGAAAERVTLAEGATVADAVRGLVARHPTLGGALPTLRFALGAAFVPADAALHDGAVLALIPPVGGG